ncbi:MAG: DotU family type IV/VI secretion system protein [Pirellulaceae bacterium]|nr:DotU family type IV/VI secretion system protein [Pirellulaceae bacterium]
MQPEFAKAIDPIFVAAIRLESRIESQVPIVTADERATLIRKIEEAESKLGQRDEWKLSKYAICACIDSRLIEMRWQARDWWKDNCLEKKFFGTRDAHEEFFKRAIEAGALPQKNALEVFYLAVVLGFRGFYSNSDQAYSRKMSSQFRIPNTIEEWCREVARSLHLRQGRPAIPGIVQTGGTAKPISGKATFILFAMLSTLMVAIAIACGILLYRFPNT